MLPRIPVCQPAPGISLVVATVGRTQELWRLFESLIAQTVRDFEIIVVDQNDDARLQPIISKARTAGLIVQHIPQAEKNVSRARNCGLRAASRAIVGFPDDDCWYEPEVIESVLTWFNQDDKIAGIVARWAERTVGTASEPYHLSWHLVRRFREINMSSIQIFFRCIRVRELGGFDESLGVSRWFGAGEDTDLVMRFVSRGEKVLYGPHIVVHHPWNKESPGSVGDRWASARSRARGTGALCAKHGLSPCVIVRGLLAPIVKCFLPPYRTRSIAAHLATTLGRWEGYARWRSNGRAGGSETAR